MVHVLGTEQVQLEHYIFRQGRSLNRLVRKMHYLAGYMDLNSTANFMISRPISVRQLIHGALKEGNIYFSDGEFNCELVSDN